MNKPTKPEHFIGKTAINARILFNRIPKLQQIGMDVEERRYLFTGPPGTGKTTLAELMAKALTTHSSFIEQINGQSCTIETVREWSRSAHYVPYGTMVQIVDEIDAASPAACNELRTYLDKLGSRTVFLATTNKRLDELPEQLQSRFKVFFFPQVPEAEIANWITSAFSLPWETCQNVASGAGGNVRSARLSALSIVEAQEAYA